MSGELNGLQNIGMVELAQLVDARPRVMGDSVPAPWRPDIEASHHEEAAASPFTPPPPPLPPPSAL